MQLGWGVKVESQSRFSGLYLESMRPLLLDLSIRILDVPHTEYLSESGEGLALEGDIRLFIVKSSD